MITQDLVQETLQNYVTIKKEFKKFSDYVTQNPWIVTLPQNSSLEDVIAFREEFFVDSYNKVYKQLKKQNPELIDKGPQLIYYYQLIPDFYQNQLKKGYHLGDKDENGFLVTGTNIILNKQAVDVTKFLNFYYTSHN